MAERPSEVDREVLDDLRCVEQCSTFFGPANLRPEFWETFLLLKTDRTLVRNEVRRLETLRKGGYTARVDPVVLDKLREIHRDHYPAAQKLRDFLSKLPSPPEGMRLELAIVFIMSAPRGRETAARWLGVPGGALEEASLRLRVMGRLIDSYCKALFEARVAPAEEAAVPEPVRAEAPPPPAPFLASVAEPPPILVRPAPVVVPPPIPMAPARAAEPAKAEGPTAAYLTEPTIVLSAAIAAPPPAVDPLAHVLGDAPAPPPPVPASALDAPALVTISAVKAAPSAPEPPRPPPPKPLDVEALFRLPAGFVEDLRRAQQARFLLAALRKPVPEEWRLLVLLTTRKDEARRAISELAHLKERGKPGEFPGAALNLRDKIVAASDPLADLAGNLRGYLTRTLGAWAGEAEELAAALILIVPGGTERVRRWMGRLEGSRDEARKVADAALARARSLRKSLLPEAAAPSSRAS